MNKVEYVLVLAMLISMIPYSALNAAEDMDGNSSPGKVPTRLGIEYLFPTDASRNIRTVNLNSRYRIRESNISNLTFNAVLTATYACGDITQLEGSLYNGTLREVSYDSEAFGVGPGIEADLRLWDINQFLVSLNASGSIIFFDRDFPAGGDRYNFMWRIRAAFGLIDGVNHDISLGYQWMHVSNGQGVGPQNPSYDSKGHSLQFTVNF